MDENNNQKKTEGDILIWNDVGFRTKILPGLERRLT